MSLFDNITDGLITPEDDIFLEFVSSESLPYLKMINKKVAMPQGHPTGKGNLCFLYTNSFEDSLSVMFNSSNLLPNRKYRLYYYPFTYTGRIFGKYYRDRDPKRRKEINDTIARRKLIPFTKMSIPSSETRNIFIDLHRYFNIFAKYTARLTLSNYIKEYWAIMEQMISENWNVQYDYRFVYVDLTKFNLGKGLRANVKHPLFMLYYTIFRFYNKIDLSFFNLDFYFVNGKYILKINPSKLTEKDHAVLRIEMKKILRGIHNQSDALIDLATDEEQISADEKEEIIADNILAPLLKDKDNKSNLLVRDEEPDKKDETNIDDIEDQVASIVRLNKNEYETRMSNFDKAIGARAVTKTTAKEKEPEKASEPEEKPATVLTNKDEEKIADASKEEINDDSALIAKIYEELNKDKPKITPSSARDAMLREKQKDIKVRNMTIGDLEKIKASDIKIPTTDISKSLTTTNESLKEIRFTNFDKAYNDNLYTKDIVDAVLSLNDKSIPMNVLDFNIKDTSDELNYKETLVIHLEDSNRKRHTLKVDIPKFIEDKFMYYGGNKKLLKYQNFFYPVVKIGPATVQIVTNYSKIIVERKDNKNTSAVDRFKKLLKKSDELKMMVKAGSVISNNTDAITTLEYDSLSKTIAKFKSGTLEVFFSQPDARAYADKKGFKIVPDKLFIGVEKGKPIYLDINTQKDSNNRGLIDIIMENTTPELYTEYKKIRPSKTGIIAEANIMSKAIPVGVMLCIWEGLTSVLKKAKINYRLENKLPSELNPNESIVVFKDCVLVYETTTVASLLLNGLSVLDTNSFDILQMDSRDTYLDYILKRYGNARTENALMNFYEFMIDPITKEILNDRNMPEDLVSLVVYAIELLADSQFVPEINQGLSRIRRNEVIPAVLYKAISSAYLDYRNNNGRKQMTIAQNAVFKLLADIPTLENYSTLNPFLEMQLSSNISAKGFRGLNLDRSYTIPKRSYDESMIGTYSPGQSPDANVGVMRYLAAEPQVTNLRGYVDVVDKKDYDKLKDVNIFSPSEMCIPLGGYLDDPTRLGHALKQSSHVIPVVDSAPVLISNGGEEVARFKLSSDFIINAKEDGEIVDFDEKTNIMIAKYKSGKTQAINLESNIVKNSNGGFFMSYKLKSDLKVGDKFKKNDVLAYHKDFFTNDKYNNCRLNMGTFCKVAIMASYGTYEDGTIITKSFSERAASEMVFLKSAVIGKNANVDYIVKKGDHITVGDPLCSFDTSYDDESLNALLARMGDDEKASMLENTKNVIPSKYSGVIEDIKIYSTVDLDELSPSLKKIVSAYWRGIKAKKDFVSKYDNTEGVYKAGMLFTETTSKTVPDSYGVVKGQKMDEGVLIEFYIKHSETLEVGSKIA